MKRSKQDKTDIKIQRPKRRIPLPEKTEKVHKVKTKYNRKQKHNKDWETEDGDE